MNVNSNLKEVDFLLNPDSDFSANYFCKNPEENSSFSKNENIQNMY